MCQLIWWRGSNGILGKATEAVEVSKLAAQKEQLQLDLAAAQMDAISSGKLEIEQKTLTEIIEKYGKLQEDRDTIVTENGNISLKEIYPNLGNNEGLVPDENTNETVDNENISMLLAEMQTLKTEVTKLKNVTKTIDDIYPVGSMYLSTNLATASEVANKLGGTWESYASGRTLVGVGNSDQDFNPGQTGGESNHTLTEAEMPNHSHDYLMDIAGDFGKKMGFSLPNTDTSTITSLSGFAPTTSFASGTRYGTFNIQSSGGNQMHNNLQPYITVYMYQRIH